MSEDPVRLGVTPELKEMIERFAKRGEQYEKLPPEEKARLAKADADEARRAQIREHEERCAAILPPIYRKAEVTHPGINAWLQSGDSKPSLLIEGNVGVGKTWQSCGIIKRFLISYRNIVFVTAQEMFWNLQPGHHDDPVRYMQRLKTCSLLVVDDLGAIKDTEARIDALMMVVDDRYRWARATIITTNVPAAQFTEKFSERVASRLAEICDVVTMTGPDRRRQQAEGVAS